MEITTRRTGLRFLETYTFKNLAASDAYRQISLDDVLNWGWDRKEGSGGGKPAAAKPRRRDNQTLPSGCTKQGSVPS